MAETIKSEGVAEATAAPATGQAGADALSGTPSDSLCASESSPYAPGGAKFGKVCVHDKLERSCDECRDALDLAAKDATIKALQDRVRALENACMAAIETIKYRGDGVVSLPLLYAALRQQPETPALDSARKSTP